MSNTSCWSDVTSEHEGRLLYKLIGAGPFHAPEDVDAGKEKDVKSLRDARYAVLLTVSLLVIGWPGTAVAQNDAGIREDDAAVLEALSRASQALVERVQPAVVFIGTEEKVGEEAVELPPDSEVARFGDSAALYLLGLDGDFEAGSTARLRLAWHTGPAGLDTDYAVFLHLLDAEGRIAQQWDAPPTGGWYPTAYWKPGEVVLDEHTLDLSPMLAPGHYQLIAGLYRTGGIRLPLDDGSDFVKLATIELEP